MAKRSKVYWLAAAEEKVRRDLKPLLTRELSRIFAAPDYRRITVHDCLKGYGSDQMQKVILAVEVRSKQFYRMHIVKLGSASEVSADYKGWRRCFTNRYVGGRVFVAVTGQRLPRRRAAAIYEDAYTFFGLDRKRQNPQDLEKLVLSAVSNAEPDCASIERVLCQIFGDLQRWFYWTASPKTKPAILFYRRRLSRALERWAPAESTAIDDAEECHWRSTLRQDALWLFCGQDRPDSDIPAQYLDPYEFVTWALDAGKIPKTLIGRSHGDLNGRNILVGARRGEAELPIVIDYGEMTDANVLAWDFVKLETELKTRVAVGLFEDAAARAALLSRRKGKPPQEHYAAVKQILSAGKDPQHDDLLAGIVRKILARIVSEDGSRAAEWRALRAQRLTFIFEFESLLADATAQIEGRQDAESRHPPKQESLFPENEKINRALRILVRIRQEAALCLGYEQPGRQTRWRDEYYFALAVYGLATAKWPDYDPYWSECALVCAGVALARTELARRVITRQIRPKAASERPASYRVPLRRAHERWIAGDACGAMAALSAVGGISGPTPLLQQEHGLILAEQGKLEEARTLLEPLVHLSVVFGNYETLSRLGRVHKNLGDRAWEKHPVPFAKIQGRVPSRYYSQAYALYTIALWISGHYFPGVNAATLAVLSGHPEDAGNLAEKVLALCAEEELTAAGDDRYWIFATEGEAALVSSREKRSTLAAEHFDNALSVVSVDQIGMVQSTWDQVCRLWQALGHETVGIVVETFESHQEIWSRLEKGPLGNCGR